MLLRHEHKQTPKSAIFSGFSLCAICKNKGAKCHKILTQDTLTRFFANNEKLVSVADEPGKHAVMFW